MPIDIYYHFYSGGKFASLKALEDVYEWALSQKTARIFTSAYIRMVNGYLSAEIEKIGPDRFVLSDYRDCLSVRLDGMDKVPDLSRCSNILGYDILPEGVFVHLRPGSDRAELVLSADRKVNSGKVFLKSASGWVLDFRPVVSGVSFIFECFSRGEVIVGGLVPGKDYRVLSTDGVPLEIKSNDRGEVFIKDIASGTVEIVGN